MQFDPNTLFAITTVFSLLLGLISAATWWIRRAQPGFGRWTTGNLLLVLCALLATSRAFAPDWIGILGANLVLVTAMVLYLEGAREFRGWRTHVWPVYAAATLTMLIVTYFDYYSPNVNVRIIAISLFGASICASCAVTLSKGMRQSRSVGTVFTSGAFGLCGLLLIARAVYFTIAPTYTDLFAPTLINQIFLAGFCLSIAGCPIGFILMADERVIRELREAESKVARVNRELAEALEWAESHARRAAEADAAKTEFVGIMAHEIRNPLASIITTAEFLGDSGLSAEQREYSESMRKSAERLLALTEDAMDLARIETGRLTIQANPFDLRSTLEEVIVMFGAAAKEKAIELTMEYPASARRMILGDSGRIRQVVVNLVANSLKFTSAGYIRISAAVEDAGPEAAVVRVAVADSGTGIPAAQIGSLFEMFSRGSERATGTRKGSGMGLTISKKLVELMGGAIHVDTERDKGSRFWFELRLPIAQFRPFPGGTSS